MSGIVGNDGSMERSGLERLADGELTAEADRAWQRGDTARIEQVKAERARRKNQKARERAVSEVMQGGMSLCAFAGLTALLIVFGVVKTGHMINLVDLVIPAGLAGLSYYVFKGSHWAAIAGFAIALGAVFLSIRFWKPGAIVVGWQAAAAGATWLAVRGSFTLVRLGEAESIATTTPPPGPLPQGEGERLVQRE
jgi:hypothetical protein